MHKQMDSSKLISLNYNAKDTEKLQNYAAHVMCYYTMQLQYIIVKVHSEDEQNAKRQQMCIVLNWQEN
jgi:hypothetical protein